MKKSILIPIFYLISLAAFGQSNPQSIQIKKEGFIAYKVEVVDYDSLINKTRSQAGVGKLERKSEFDLYELMAGILFGLSLITSAAYLGYVYNGILVSFMICVSFIS